MKKCFATLATFVVVLGLSSMAFADPLGGPLGGVTRVQAFGSNVHSVMYQGGEQADFAIVGDGDTSLNIIVRDSAGREVVRTTGSGDRARVTWRPAFTGMFHITVINHGGVYNQYSYRAY